MCIRDSPDKMAKLGLTPSDVMNAIKEQNLQAPAGRVGMRPSPKDQEFTYTVSAPGRLVTEEEFSNIIIRETETGAQIRIKDVGRVELGSQDYNSFGRLDGKPAGAMAVYLLPGANQLQAAEGIYNVAVVGGDGTIDLRMVKPGERIGTLWLIDSGLKAGERIVVEGLQKVRAGAKVKAETVSIEEGGASPPPAPKAEGEAKAATGK